MKERIILHCDLNNFFASVSLLSNPTLYDLPVAVCGSVEERHGIVLAKNEEAKRYGVMYHVLKDNKAKDGKCDIMVREEDTEKVNRIFERFRLGTPNQMTIRKAVKKSMEGRQDVPNRSTPGQMPTNEFIERLFSKKQQQQEKSYSTNPSQARTEKSRLSEPTSVSRGAQGYSRDESDAALRPSIKGKLKLYQEEIEREKAKEKSAPKKNTQSKAPTHPNQKKKKGNKEHVRG